MTGRTSPALSLVDVVKTYPGRPTPAVDGLSLTIDRGEIVSLVGPNGAGKTTTIEMMVGMRRPTAGTVRTLGLDPVAQRDEIRRRVAVQPQQAAVFDQQTVTEILGVWASFHPDPRPPEEVLDQLGLGECRDVRVAKLSGGQRQRVLVGLALVARPDLLVLDEPSTGMDPNARQELWAAVRGFRAQGGTVLLSTHSMDEAEQLSDRVGVVDAGRLEAFGTPEELVRRHAAECEVRATLPDGTDVDDLTRLGLAAAVLDPTAGPRSRVAVSTRDTDTALRVLTSVGAHHLQVRDAGLDGVFRALTGHDLADDGRTAAGATPTLSGGIR
jgi:ABC-2 type transport system ATP-binding protein